MRFPILSDIKPQIGVKKVIKSAITPYQIKTKIYKDLSCLYQIKVKSCSENLTKINIEGSETHIS